MTIDHTAARQRVGIAIIGAGPYGLSLAAHLRARGVAFRIFGTPMRAWTSEMPKDMLLKSEGFASNLSDPGGYTLKQYCHDNNVPYADMGLPAQRETLARYALAFQKKLVPDVDERQVRALEPCEDGFRLVLNDGEALVARAVVVAVGLTYFQHIPEVLRGCGDLVTHSAQHFALDEFRGRDVAVIGGGSSAIDIAGLLHESGAKVQLFIRGPKLQIHTKAKMPRPLLDKISAPMSGIGPGWRSILYSDYPNIFRRLPAERRYRIAKYAVGPAAGWFMRERIEGKVPVFLRHNLERASAAGDRIELEFATESGKKSVFRADHVIAGTGYRYDVPQISFISKSLIDAMQTRFGTPVLRSDFQSSVPNLYFMGPIALHNFGPVMRFIVGADFAARTVAASLSRARTSAPTISAVPRLSAAS